MPSAGEWTHEITSLSAHSADTRWIHSVDTQRALGGIGGECKFSPKQVHRAAPEPCSRHTQKEWEAEVSEVI